MKADNPIKKTRNASTNDVSQLIDEYQPRLKAFIRGQVSTQEDAEDITQDVLYQFVKACENKLNPIEQVASWLFRVARNTIINKAKKKHEEELPIMRYDDDGQLMDEFSDVLFGDGDSDLNPEMEYMKSLVWNELDKALSDLPSEQRDAFELLELQDLPVKEVAETLGISANTLLSRKHYAVLFLRKRLTDLYKDFLAY